MVMLLMALRVFFFQPSLLAENPVVSGIAGERILVVYMSSGKGGIRRHCFELCDLLKTQGARPLLLLLPKPAETLALAREKQLDYVIWEHADFQNNAARWQAPDYVNFLEKLCKKEQIRLIHTNRPESLPGIYVLKKRLSVKIMHTIHDDSPDWHTCVDGCDAVIGVNQNIVTNVRGHFSRADRVYFNTPIFDERSYVGYVPKILEKETYFKRTFGINVSGQTVFTVLGNYWAWKNQEVAIRAFAKLVYEHKVPVKLLLAGSGGLEKKYRQLVHELGLSEHVFVVGYVDDAKQLLWHSDVLLNTSKRESFGIALMEAAMFKKPIIATRDNGSSALVKHEQTALLFHYDKPDELVACVQRYLADIPLRNRLAVACHDYLVANFTRDQSMRQLLAIYAQLLIA